MELARGYYVRPTVFGPVDPKASIAREEIFGPVLVIIPYDSEAEAVAIANDTVYGLAAYVQSADLSRRCSSTACSASAPELSGMGYGGALAATSSRAMVASTLNGVSTIFWKSKPSLATALRNDLVTVRFRLVVHHFRRKTGTQYAHVARLF